jgi:diguanylate cyclase (GGDEF)-like protein/PAS domain S-box-containing protein
VPAAVLPIESLPDPALVVAPGGRVEGASPSALRMFRRRSLEGLELDALLLDPGPLLVVDGDHRLGTGLRADGTPFAVEASVGALPGGRRLVLLRELREERLLDEAQRFFDVAFDSSPIGMALFNSDGEYVRVNDALCAFLGRPREELLDGVRDNELTHPDDRAADVEVAWSILRGERTTWTCEKRFVRPGGEVVWALANLVFLRDDEGRPLAWVGQFVDVTQRHAAERALRRLADRDPLTDLLNRRSFDAALAQAGPAAVVVLDLDGFKAVNDGHGHHAGDAVLVAVADVLRARLRRTDVVARLGGDEFAALLPGCAAAEAEEIARGLVAAVAGLRLGSGAVSASAGVATGESAATLLRAADRAMYEAKAAGRGRAHAVAA